MDRRQMEFQQRLSRIDRGHSAPGPRDVVIQPDGLTVPRARRGRRRLWVPWRTLLLVALCCTLLKSYFIWFVGTEAYDARIAEVFMDSRIETPGVWISRTGPVSLLVAAQYNLVVAIARGQ